MLEAGILTEVRRDHERRGLLKSTIEKRHIQVKALARWMGTRSVFEATRTDAEEVSLRPLTSLLATSIVLAMRSSGGDLLTTTQAAALLGLERSVIARWAQFGKLQVAMRLPGETGAYLFLRSDVEAMRPEAHPRKRAT